MKTKLRTTDKIFPKIHTKQTTDGNLVLATNIRTEGPNQKHYYIPVFEEFHINLNSIDSEKTIENIHRAYAIFIQSCYKTRHLFIIDPNDKNREKFGVTECRYSDITEKVRAIMMSCPNLSLEIT